MHLLVVFTSLIRAISWLCQSFRFVDTVENTSVSQDCQTHAHPSPTLPNPATVAVLSGYLHYEKPRDSHRRGTPSLWWEPPTSRRVLTPLHLRSSQGQLECTTAQSMRANLTNPIGKWVMTEIPLLDVIIPHLPLFSTHCHWFGLDSEMTWMPLFLTQIIPFLDQ